MDEKITRELVKTRRAVRAKYRALRQGREAVEHRLEETFRPIVEPLKHLQTTTAVPPPPLLGIKKEEVKEEVQDELKGEPDDYHLTDDEADENVELLQTPAERKAVYAKVGRVTEPYIRLLFNDDQRIDPVYGVYLDNGKIMIGDKELHFVEDKFTFGDRVFKGTVGLYELMFTRMPDVNQVRRKDYENYKFIMKESNALRQDSDPQRDYIVGSGSKYTNVIRVLFPEVIVKRTRADYKLGQGLVRRSAPSYLYWNDPNELVDRLRLLIASQNAGHTGHDNEINSVVEELREAGIVY